MKFQEIKERKFKRLNMIQDLLIAELLNKKDIKRDQPMEWSLKHLCSCSQLAKLLALNRGIDPEIAGIAGAVHDLYIIQTGIFENHGPIGAPIVKAFLEDFNSKFGLECGVISTSDIDLIVESTEKHTQKAEFNDKPFVELIKDVDALDRFLHGIATKDYYFTRSEKCLKEMIFSTEISS